MAFWFIPAIIAGGYIAKKLFEDDKPSRRSTSYDDRREEQERERKEKARKEYIKATKEKFQNLYQAEVELSADKLSPFGGLASEFKIQSCAKLDEFAAQEKEYRQLILQLERLKKDVEAVCKNGNADEGSPLYLTHKGSK